MSATSGDDLLATAVAAHRGPARWREVREVTARLRSGGLALPAAPRPPPPPPPPPAAAGRRPPRRAGARAPPGLGGPRRPPAPPRLPARARRAGAAVPHA